jgi:hypothetical protein
MKWSRVVIVTVVTLVAIVVVDRLKPRVTSPCCSAKVCVEQKHDCLRRK